MSTAQQPVAGTSVVRAVGELPPEIQNALNLRKTQNIVAAKIAGMSWGEHIDDTTRRAIAEWSQQFRVDPSTEIYILGNKIYLSAAFYLRRLGEMIAAGLVEYAYADHVEEDERLVKLGNDGKVEADRRLRERIAHRIPDNVGSAVVFHVKLRTLDRDIVGAKWCGTGEKTKDGKFVDPIGEAKPVETSETRAARRAMKLITSHIPAEAATSMHEIEASAEVLSKRYGESLGRATHPAVATADTQRQLTEGIVQAEYVRPATGEPVPVMTREQINRAANATDPFVTPGTETIATPFDDDPFAPTPPAGPVTENLFGAKEPMEPTAEERAAAELEEDRRIQAEDEARERRRAS